VLTARSLLRGQVVQTSGPSVRCAFRSHRGANSDQTSLARHLVSTWQRSGQTWVQQVMLEISRGPGPPARRGHPMIVAAFIARWAARTPWRQACRCKLEGTEASGAPTVCVHVAGRNFAAASIESRTSRGGASARPLKFKSSGLGSRGQLAHHGRRNPASAPIA
jgi:hypothetical protein